MRVTVFGGAGFIGSHLTDLLLEQGFRVLVADDLSTGSMTNLAHHRGNRDLEFHRLDICDDWTLPGDCDLVYNLASPASPTDFTARPLETLRAGSLGMQKVVDYAVRHQARLVHASTSEVYGDPLVSPQDESYRGNVDCTGPRSMYDESKRFAEALIAGYCRLGALDAGIVRIFNTYGPRLHPRDGRVVSNFVTQALRGEPMTIYGTGRQTRSFCFIDDLVRGLYRMGTSPVCGPVNLGNPHEVTVGRLADIVADIVARFVGRSPVERVHRRLPPDDPRIRRPDVTLARILLDWEPSVSLEAGVCATVHWFAETLGVTPATGLTSAPASAVTGQTAAGNP